jgi:hypothetical protein
MGFTVFHRLHHQPGKRLAYIALGVSIPGQFLNIARMLGRQRHKRFFAAQRPKLSPQQFPLRKAKRSQALSA